MTAKILLALALVVAVCTLVEAGGHKKVIIHVPLYVKKHTHKHTIVKHIHHHKKGGGGGDDHYEVLGYTYGQPKAAPHFGGGHGWHAADEGHESADSPVSFSSDAGTGTGYGLSGAGADYGDEQGYGGY